MHTQLERLKTEGVVDVFQSLKSVCIQRAGLVDTLVSKTKPAYYHSIQQEQYSLCYEVLAECLDPFDTYADFKFFNAAYRKLFLL